MYEGIYGEIKADSVMLHESACRKADWASVQAFVGYTTQVAKRTSNKEIDPEVMQLIINLQLCLSAQPDRQYALGISLSKDGQNGTCSLEVVVMSRSHLFVARQPEALSCGGLPTLAAWVHVLRNADLQALGHLSAFVNTFKEPPFDRPLSSIQVRNVIYAIDSCLAATYGAAFSRGTSAWVVQDLQQAPATQSQGTLVLRLFWASEQNFQHGLAPSCTKAASSHIDAAWLGELQVHEHLKSQSKITAALGQYVLLLREADLIDQPLGREDGSFRRLVAIVCEGTGERISLASLPTFGHLLDFAVDLWRGQCMFAMFAALVFEAHCCLQAI